MKKSSKKSGPGVVKVRITGPTEKQRVARLKEAIESGSRRGFVPDTLLMNSADADALGIEYEVEKPDSGLRDSGARAASVTGGLREPSDGITRGRYDLIPAECLVQVYTTAGYGNMEEAIAGLSDWLEGNLRGTNGSSLESLARFARTMLERAGSLAEGVRRLAVHYGRGAAKYADRNWEKGLETGRCIDSLFRHLTQYQAGDQVEDHLAAVVWNTFALMFYVPRIADGRLPKALDTYGLVRVA